VNDDDRLCLRCYLPPDIFRIDVYVPGTGYVTKDRITSGISDTVGGSRECKGWDQYFITGTDTAYKAA
jgi:hypothetical protein